MFDGQVSIDYEKGITTIEISEPPKLVDNRSEMAEPVEFAEQNTAWIGQGDVDELPAFRDVVSGENISCWRLNPAELAEVQRTGAGMATGVGRSAARLR